MISEDFLCGAVCIVWKGTFSVIKSKRPYPNAFANIHDVGELTVVIESDKYLKSDALQASDGWKLLTLHMQISLDTVGVIAKISMVLAEAGISVLIFSSCSTDHILVKEKDLPKAAVALSKLGLVVES